MPSQTLKNAVVAVVAVVAVIALSQTSIMGPSKPALQKIVHEYIMENPDVILASVDAYQRKSTQTQQNDALKRSGAFLFEDAATPETGNPKGDVTIVEFFDYNCPYCKNIVPALENILQNDKNVRLIFKEFPILGAGSKKAAAWALAAHRQGKYVDFHNGLMSARQKVDDALLEKVAKAVGLDIAQAEKDAQSGEIEKQIEKNISLGASLGLSGTPVLIIGDEIIPGAVSLEEMQKAIADQRAKTE